MKLAGVIVVYEPDIEALINNILSVIEDVEFLLIFKNSIIDLDNIYLKKYADKLIFLGEGKNVGIASALNAGVIWAMDNLCTHILTLDQDSSFQKYHLAKFKSIVEQSNLINVGVYCPNIDNRGSMLVNSNDFYIKVPDSITSGSLFPISTFVQCGLFEDGLFIDAVDYEYCYRINVSKGLSTIIYPEIILTHEVGYPTKINFGFMSDNYSAFRTYFIIKNHILIWRRYSSLFQKSYKITLIKTHIVYRVAKILIGEKDKMAKLRSITLGVLHGLSKKKI